MNLSALQERAAEEYFRQPVVDTFDVRICLAKSVRHMLDFGAAEERELHRIGERTAGYTRAGARGCNWLPLTGVGMLVRTVDGLSHSFNNRLV